MEEKQGKTVVEEMELNQRPVTQNPTASPVDLTSASCTTEQLGEIPEDISADSQAPVAGHLQNLNAQLPSSAQCSSILCKSEQRGEIPDNDCETSSASLAPTEGSLNSSNIGSDAQDFRNYAPAVEGGLSRVQSLPKIQIISANTTPKSVFGSSKVTGGWHFHGVPISANSSTSPLAFSFQKARSEIKNSVPLAKIDLSSQEISEPEKLSKLKRKT